MRNLNALAADLTSVGVKYKIVTAAESKDIEEAARFGKFSLVRYEITPKAK